MALNENQRPSMWIENDQKLEKEFFFKNFKIAFDFMTKVADISETQNHHPTFINTYNKVKIILTTHDAGNKITEKDTAMAQLIDQIVL